MEIGALGQVLPDEPVGVLVESALPGMVGVGEVALGVESLGDGLMVGELLAVVIGERVDKVGMRLQCCEQGVGGLGLTCRGLSQWRCSASCALQV